MKIDFSGFVPGKNIISGLASNIDVQQAIEKASFGYIKQIEQEADIIEHNFHKISALYNLKQIITDLRSVIITEVLPALSSKTAVVDEPGYIIPHIKNNAHIASFSVSNIKTADPQQIKVEPFYSSTESITDNFFNIGTMEVALSSFITKYNDDIFIAKNDYITQAALTMAGKNLQIERFSLGDDNVLSVKIGNEIFTTDELSKLISLSEQVIFTNNGGDILTIILSQEINVEDAPTIFNNVFSIYDGVAVIINEGDSLQDINYQINQNCNAIGVSSYILKIADNKFSLVIKSLNPGEGFVIYDSLLPSYDLIPASSASLNLDGNYIEGNSNSIELAVGEIAVELINDSPFGKNIKLSILNDISKIRESLISFAKYYNELLNFYEQQTKHDYMGKWAETATLHDSNALRIAKTKFADTLMQKSEGYNLADFGILFDSNSNLYVNINKLENNLINLAQLEQIMHNILITADELNSYNGVVSKEIDQIIQNGELHSNKISALEKKLISVQNETYKKFTSLEAKVANANYILQLLEDQMRLYSNSK